MRTILILFFLLIMQQAVRAQEANKTYVVDFKPESVENCKPGLSMMFESSKVNDYSFLKGIPVKPQLFTIHAVKMARTKGSERNDYLYIYVGLDKKAAKKQVIVDANCNHDFGDDRRYEFDMGGYALKYDYYVEFIRDKGFIADITVPNKGRGKASIYPILINPFAAYEGKRDYPSEEAYQLEVLVSTTSVFRGTTQVNGLEISFMELPWPVLIKDSIYPDNDFYVLESDTLILTDMFKLNDTMLIAGKKIHLKKIEGLCMYLEDLGFYADSSKIGDYLPALYPNRFEDGSPVLLNGLMQDKYVLIDFWGSWCAPCIAGFPKLKEMYQKLSRRGDVVFLGITLDRPKNLDKATDIIKENGVAWNNYWVDRENFTNISTPHGKLHIRSFPTYLLIGKDGRMIRRTSSEGLDEILEFLLNQPTE